MVAKRYKVLIVDDAEINRSLLSDMLREEYDILEASNGVEAVTLLNHYHSEISLALLDIVMPEMDGFEVLASMHKSGYLDTIPVIIISAETSSSYIDHAYDLGATEYVNRPFDEKTVKRRVRNTITLYSKQKLLEDMVTEQMLEKEKSNLIMVEVLSHIVEFRNGESGLHVLHIRVITETLLKRLVKKTDAYALSPSRIALIANASAMHDIGKISIPEHILNKRGRLTPEEYEIVKAHSVTGAEMLEGVTYYKTEELVRVARDICRWHHERYDGGGYPDGLKGEEIPIAAQVVALADVYDALTNERVYKPAYTHREALRMILNGECGVFNPLLLECLVEAAPYLEKELKIRSAGGISKEELLDTTRTLLHSSDVSNRTLALLEQERTKYQFFAKMSKEIQFEYDRHSNLLTMSDWGAQLLGIKGSIVHPQQDEALAKIFAPEDYRDIQKRLRSVTEEDPIVEQTYCLHINGSRRWYKAVARPLWLGHEGEMTGVIGKFSDYHEEHEELHRLKQLAHHDSLTGLYNREYALKRIETVLDAGTREGRKYALLLLDLDFFKKANDRFGHIFGDKLLMDVAEKLKNSIREEDIAARIGGDEFLLFLEYRENVASLVERLFRSTSGRYETFEINASMGVALAPQDGTSYLELFHHADQALYAAKKDGRKRYCYYDESMKDLLSVLSPVDGEGAEEKEGGNGNDKAGSAEE
ncbi:diguanylate cyclase [Enterocloster aldenensis]|uniref:diguanylate cyclase n=1 Tax=Enterocloster aldenensis TaxID=358742 RepID=UPI0040278C57